MNAFPPVATLLPHDVPMVLVDRLLAHDCGRATCAVTVREGAPFVVDGRVATLVTLEYMAQTVAAFAGYTAQQADNPIQVGLLLGCRKMDSYLPWLPVGSALRVDVELVWGNAQLGKFNCTVSLADGTPTGTLVAIATLNVAEAPAGTLPT